MASIQKLKCKISGALPDYLLLRSNAYKIPLANESVDCVVTSPPYWNLRNYSLGKETLGLEQTPEEYISHLVIIFKEVHRVLKSSGTLWLVIGDSYAASRDKQTSESKWKHESNPGKSIIPKNCKSGDLVGIPWRVALALRKSEWYLRRDIIWYKPSAKPENVRDRPTTAHEYIFLLTKQRHYFYDYDAVKQNSVRAGEVFVMGHKNQTALLVKKLTGNMAPGKSGIVGEFKNLRSVWKIQFQPGGAEHVAKFPEELVSRCIKAGCPKDGVVFDPFAGSGTVGVVAAQLNKKFVLADLGYHQLMKDNLIRLQLGLAKK